MFMSAKMTFKKEPKEKLNYSVLANSMKKLEKEINRVDFNVYCADREEEGYIMGDYELDDGIYGEIYVECDDMYEERIKNLVEGSKNWTNYLYR